MTNIDLNMVYGSPEHLMFAIPAVLLCYMFNFLPAVILFLYPVKILERVYQSADSMGWH